MPPPNDAAGGRNNVDERPNEWIDAQRRAGLLTSLETRVLPLFAGRVLPFDLGCTQACAKLMARARASGLATASAAGYIAAIAAANGLTVATRDIGPFEAAGAAVINPWQA